MASPLTQEYNKFKADVLSTQDTIYNAFVDANARNDKDAVKALELELNDLIGAFDQVDVNYRQEQEAQKSTLLDEISSGEGIGYKRSSYTTYPSNFGNPGEGAQASTEEYFNRTKETPKLLRSKLSALLETDEKNIDVERGLNADDLILFRGLRTQKQQEEWLSKKFRNVIPIVIGGKPNYILNGGGNKFMVANPDGVSLADASAFIATEALPITASILGGTLALGATAQSGPASIVATSAAANAAYGAASMPQDAFFRYAAGNDIEGGEIAGRRGTEMAAGFGIDLVTGGIGSKVSKGFGKNIVNEAARELDDAAIRMTKAGFPMQSPVIAAGGRNAIIAGQELTGAFPNSRFAQQYSKIREQLYAWQEAKFDKSIQAPKVDIAARLESDINELATKIKRKNASLGSMPDQWAQRRLASIAPDDVNQVELGNTISGMVAEAEQVGKQMKDEVYSTFYQQADEMGVGVPKGEVLDTIKQALADPRNQFKDSPEIRKLLKAVEAEPSDVISIQGLVNARQAASGATSKGMSSSNAQQVASGVAEALDNKLKSVISKNGLADQWKQVGQTFDEASLAFRRSSPGKVLSEKFGDQVLSPDKAVKAVLSDPKAAEDMLMALRNTGNEQGADVLQKQLQDSYIEQIGLSSKIGFTPSKTNSNYNPAMIDTLWSKNPLEADRVKSTIKEINQLFSGKEVNAVNLDVEDVAQLLKPISINERKALMDSITEKVKLQRQQDRIMSNEIVKLAKEGDWRALDNDEFAKTMLNARTTDVLEITNKLKLTEKRDIGSDMFAMLLRKYSTSEKATNEVRHGFQLWDADAVISDLKQWKRGQPGAPQWVKNMDVVAGKGFVDEFIAASRMNSAVRPIAGTVEDPVRVLASGSGVKLYTSPISYGHHKALTWAYGSGALRPFMRSLSRDVGSEQYSKNLKRLMQGVLGSTSGLRAAAYSARNDAGSQEAMLELIKAVEDNNERELQEQ